MKQGKGKDGLRTFYIISSEEEFSSMILNTSQHTEGFKHKKSWLLRPLSIFYVYICTSFKMFTGSLHCVLTQQSTLAVRPPSFCQVACQ